MSPDGQGRPVLLFIMGMARGLLHDQVTVSVTRPDWPVWS
ncbi:Uncharacterised protein [Mycobacteroides abscessus subsp. massiliense]|nr:Uncharacterised protein [Mycobacteroides abscessus subsp. massiliense]